ncbi:hypothetical protein R6Q57_000927 [Mikania cordata]
MKLEMLVPKPSFATILPLQKHHKSRTRLHVKAQSLRDKDIHVCMFGYDLFEFIEVLISLLIGRSSNIVDSNMKLLKERIEVMRTKERLEINHRSNGWDYTSKYIHKNPKKQPQHLQTIALICGASSLSILSGTLLLCIFSIIVHLKM